MSDKFRSKFAEICKHVAFARMATPMEEPAASSSSQPEPSPTDLAPQHISSRYNEVLIDFFAAVDPEMPFAAVYSSMRSHLDSRVRSAYKNLTRLQLYRAFYRFNHEDHVNKVSIGRFNPASSVSIAPFQFMLTEWSQLVDIAQTTSVKRLVDFEDNTTTHDVSVVIDKSDVVNAEVFNFLQTSGIMLFCRGTVLDHERARGRFSEASLVRLTPVRVCSPPSPTSRRMRSFPFPTLCIS